MSAPRDWPAADTVLRAHAQAARAPAPDALAHAASTLGDPWAMVALALLGAVALARRGARRIALTVATVPLAAVLAFNAIKLTVRRVRPPGAVALGELRFSFPSGHATVVAATSAVVAWALVREGIVSRRVASVTAVTWAALVGASRVWLDAHWASDVLAGWALGGAIAALGTWLGGATLSSRHVVAKGRPEGARVVQSD